MRRAREEDVMTRGSFDLIRMGRAPGSVGMQADTCLYYPNYSVQDEQWAKQVLLFWDSISTIIPRDVDPGSIDSELFRSLAEGGALRTWQVELPLRERVATTALQLIDEGRTEAFPQESEFRINFGKMTNELRSGLEQRDLRCEPEGADLVVDGSIGLLVMAVLAHALAEETRAAPLTDQVALGKAYISVLGPPRDDANLRIVERDISLMVPDLDSVDLEKWLRFRKRNKERVKQYRDSVKGIASEVARAQSEDQVADIIDRRAQQIQQELDSRKSAFQKLTSAFKESMLVIVADLSATAAISPSAKGLIGSLVPAVGVVGHEYRRERHHETFVQKISRLGKKA